MPKNIIATLAAGLLSAALLLVVIIGQPGALIFAYLAPLPIYCLGLALGYRLAAVAVLGGGVAIAALTTPLAGIGFLAVIGVPAVILLQRALLARPGATAAGGVEWYPAGHLTAWWAGIAAVWMIAAVIITAGDGIETVMGAQFYDANVSIPGCDKNMPGCAPRNAAQCGAILRASLQVCAPL